VCVGLRTPVGWKTELVLEIAREARVWKLLDWKNESSCWEITGRGLVEGVLCGTSQGVDARCVFGEWLIVLNCSVLGFGGEINFHREQNPRYVTILYRS
jgi:hypothetical protein